jgi:tetratricopeptide (TPR) repeat protein
MENTPIEKQTLRILFLASDPSNASRLHLGKELQSVRNKLVGNQNFEIKDHLATKPNDVMNEIMNYKPHIVHFSGHGFETGELCFENDRGEAKVIPPEALASLFRLATDHVKCVIVNTCYAEKQAKAIAEYVPVVIGTKKEISDDAAFNFSTGFYTALEPDLSQNSLHKAFNLGCIAIQFDGNLEEHLTPILIFGSPEVRFSSEVDSAFSSIVNPKGYAVKTLIKGLSLTGKKMGLSDEIVTKIIDDKIWRLEYHNDSILEYENNLKEILRDEFPLSESSMIALSHLQNGLNLSNEDVKAIQDRILSDPKIDSAYSWFDRGSGQAQLINYEKAIEYYSKAIEKNNEYSGAFAGRGTCYSRINEFQLAIDDFNNAIQFNINWELSYNLSSTYFDRGLAYFDILPKEDENVILAKKDWTKSIELNPREGNAFYNRGLANQDLREFDDAIDDFKKSLEFEQTNKSKSITGIIKCYSELGKPKEIEYWSNEALKLLGKAPIISNGEEGE